MTPFFRLALPVLALMALSPLAARAQTVSPYPAPTIIKTQPYTINTPGYYQLGADLVSSAATGDIITINSSNVTLDFGGHYISGPSTANSTSLINGVHAYELGNINIRNGTIAYCYRGINLDGTGQGGSININQHIDNMLVTYCYYEGIRFNAASYSVASNCRVSFTGNNNTTTDALAVYIYGGSSNQTLNNTVINTVALNGFAYGIYGSPDTAHIGNVVTGVTAPSGSKAFGIYQGAFADHNKIYSAQTGLYNVSKYSDTLTVNCTTSFSGGTAVGNGNN